VNPIPTPLPPIPDDLMIDAIRAGGNGADFGAFLVVLVLVLVAVFVVPRLREQERKRERDRGKE